MEEMSGEKRMENDNRTKQHEDKRRRVWEEEQGIKQFSWIEMT